jgi:hypothetical protein
MSRFKKPDMSLRDAVKAARDQEKGQKGVRKQFTMLRTKDASSSDGADAAYDSGIMRPTDEELAVINTMTRSPKTADEVVVFSTLSCNDLVDRDLDKFPTKTVKDFAELPAPFGSIGKSFMVGHDYSKLPVGRIFDAGTKVLDGATFMTNKVYLPNTEQHKNFIENMDYGVYWAVSVGVMLDDVKCSVCEEHMSSWGGYCFAGHIKGLYYPEGDEGDPTGWDFAEPVKETTKGAVQCIGLMDGARDFFELSQVFLGAQFYAGLEKSPNMKGVLKAASAGSSIVTLSADEAKELPFQHVPEKVADAVVKFETTTDDEGLVTWTDDKGLVYSYDPETSEVLCLGKSQEDTTQEAQDGEGDHSEAGGEPGTLGEGSGESGTVVREPGQRDDADGDDDDASGDEDQLSGSDGSVDPPADDNATQAGADKEEAVTKASVLAAIKAAGGHPVLLSAVADAKDNGLSAVLRSAVTTMEEQDSTIKALTPKAAIGDTYIKDLRADAVSWYVKSHQVDGKGVSTESFERILTACGEDVDLIKSLRDEQVTLAQAKFPGAVRRSSFPDNPNEKEPIKAPDSHEGGETDHKVSRLHG